MRLAATETADRIGRTATDAPGWLGLAAAPTFTFMALASALDTPDMSVCAAMPSWMPVNDMALMYLLMSLFHLPPWLRLLSHRFATPLRQN